MNRKLYSLMLVAVASAVLVAGCGGSSSPTTPAKTTPAKTTPAKTTPAKTTPASTGSLSGAEEKAAAAACQSSEAHDTTLSAAAKTYLTTICSDLASGNVSALKADAQKYCAAVLASVPTADKALAQAECDSIAKL
jgi:uncharacterized protein YkwD